MDRATVGQAGGMKQYKRKWTSIGKGREGRRTGGRGALLLCL